MFRKQAIEMNLVNLWNNLSFQVRSLLVLLIAFISFALGGTLLIISNSYYVAIFNFGIGIVSMILFMRVFCSVARRINGIAHDQSLQLNENRQVKDLHDGLSLLEQDIAITNLSLKQKNAVLEAQHEELMRLAAFRQNLSDFVSETLQQGLGDKFYGQLLRRAVSVIPNSQAGSLLLRGEDGNYHYEAVVNYNFADFKDISISSDDIVLVYSENKPSHFSDLSLQADVLGDNRRDDPSTGRQLAVKDSLGIPVLIDGSNVAFLTLDNFERPDVFGIEAVGMAEVFATQIGVVLKRFNLEAELRLRQTEIEKKNAELERANRLKSEFLANMSHELRTPLTSIIGFSELLEEEVYGPLNEKQKQYTKDIFNSGNHLLSLINDILDLSKIEAGHMELDLGEHDVNELVQSVVELMKEHMQKAGISCSINMAQELDFAYVDSRKIKQILFNLLSNAAKFTSVGGSIEVLVNDKEDMLEFSVKDTGVGITEENLDHLFKEFSQVDSSLTRRHKGTGLGLALSKRLVELHGGTIWVESKINVGSTFCFLIPKHCENPEVTTNLDETSHNLWQAS